jgi:hypothetical protein
MVDFATTQARAKEVAPSARREGGGGGRLSHRGQAPEHFTTAHCRRGEQDVPPTDGDPHHHHRELVECAHWCQSDQTPSPVQAGTGW